MNVKMKVLPSICIGVSLIAIASPAFGQSTPNNPPVATDDAAPSDFGSDIIVRARRRDESAQDVPLVVNAVTAESIEKLNIREFEEIETLVPGLQLGSSANGIGSQASLRGVNYDVNASGNNGTIEFYLNDSPLSAGILFQSMFDVGQIEVLRGPQGTLRGRASPSGSITVTTRRPELDEVGAHANATINNIDGWNLNGAINVPIIEGVLGVRIAGVVDENEGNRVHSIASSLEPYVKTTGGRVSVAAEPADFLSLFASYTHTERKAQQFVQTESLSETTIGAPASPTRIRARDRLAAGFIPFNTTQNFEVLNWQSQVRFAGQKLDYVGSHNKQRYLASDPNDKGGFFGPSYSAALRGADQFTDSRAKQTTHELRLSNEERVFGMFDYVLGALYNKLESPTNLTTRTPLFAGIFIPQAAFPSFITTGGITAPPAAGVSLAAIINTPVIRDGTTIEKSVFGNITAHIGEDTEVSGGIRYIDYKATGSLSIGGANVAAAAENRNPNHTIYSASVKHQFTPNFMVYASYGSSWRAGSSTNPIQFRDLTNPTGTLASFYFPSDETSNSYEIGFKSDWMDNRLRLNVTAYQQDFKNYAYSSPNVYAAGLSVSGAQSVFLATPALAVGVPARVRGVEGELSFRPTNNWDLSATVSYAKSNIKNGVIPCNNYGGAVPTYAQIIAANGGQQVATCTVDFTPSTQAPFNATVQSEYRQPLSSSVDSYVRGLFNFAGSSRNDPLNPFDDVKNFGLLNLFAGIRDPEGAWEIGGYVKNVFEVERVLSRSASPQGVSYQQLFCTPADPRIAAGCRTGAITFGQTASSTYRAITMTPPREFGIQLRMQMGSR